MPDTPAEKTLTYGLRELVWGIESEVAVISNLSQRIDEHVAKLNALRAEMVERLVRLDALTAATTEPHLEQFLRAAVVTPRPEAREHFPARLYG